MIESFKDLDLDDLKPEDEDLLSKLDDRLKNKLGISLLEIKNALSQAIINKAEEISLDMPNLAPYGDYGKLLEDNESMTSFLKEEASKPDNLIIHSICEDNKTKNLLKFTFVCQAMNDGEGLTGFVYVSKSGVIRHAFAQAD